MNKVIASIFALQLLTLSTTSLLVLSCQNQKPSEEDLKKQQKIVLYELMLETRFLTKDFSSMRMLHNYKNDTATIILAKSDKSLHLSRTGKERVVIENFPKNTNITSEGIFIKGTDKNSGKECEIKIWQDRVEVSNYKYNVEYKQGKDTFKKIMELKEI